MANELTLSITALFEKGTNINETLSIQSLKRDVSGTRFIRNVQAVGTSEEAVVFGDTVPKYVFVRNLDSTNYVQLGATTGVYNIRLTAGDVCLFPLEGSTLFAKANTAACNIQVFAVDA